MALSSSQNKPDLVHEQLQHIFETIPDFVLLECDNGIALISEYLAMIYNWELNIIFFQNKQFVPIEESRTGVFGEVRTYEDKDTKSTKKSGNRCAMKTFFRTYKNKLVDGDEELETKFWNTANRKYTGFLFYNIDGSSVKLNMPYVGERDLASYLVDKNVSREDKYAALIKVVEELQRLHSLGIFHNDIKGENIRIDNSSGSPQIFFVDFGMTKDLTEKNRIDDMHDVCLMLSSYKESLNIKNNPGLEDVIDQGRLKEIEGPEFLERIKKELQLVLNNLIAAKKKVSGEAESALSLTLT